MPDEPMRLMSRRLNFALMRLSRVELASMLYIRVRHDRAILTGVDENNVDEAEITNDIIHLASRTDRSAVHPGKEHISKSLNKSLAAWTEAEQRIKAQHDDLVHTQAAQAVDRSAAVAAFPL